MTEERPGEPAGSAAASPALQAFRILRSGLVLVPLISGLDKFLDLLVPWQTYLTPLIPQATGISAHTFMRVTGALELGISLLVAWMPRIGAYVLALWLWAIIVNLLLVPGYWDVGLRDFGLSLGALALARLSVEFQRP